MSTEQLTAELRSGTRLVIYHYTVSLLIVSSRRPSEVFVMRRGDSRFEKGVPYTLLSLLLGWWGLPWGPIFTVWSVIENCAGGEDVTEKIKNGLEKERQRRKPGQIRVMGFSRLWPKLNQEQFTTIRFPRKDKDWVVGEVVKVTYRLDSKERLVIGTTQIVSKTPIMLHDLSDAEAREDGYEDLQAMVVRMHDVHGDRVLSEPMNKLRLKFVKRS